MINSKMLAEVRRAEWASSKEFLENARILIDDCSSYEALYDGLRNKIAYLFRSGASVRHVSEWQDALSTVMGLISGTTGMPSADTSLLDTRLSVLRDLSSDLISQLNVFSVKLLKNQPHFKACLQLLADNDSELPRADLLKKLALKEANGTRVIKILETERLVQRKKKGRTVTVKLTSQGRDSLWLWNQQSGEAALTTDEKIDGVDQITWIASASIESHEMSV